MKDKKGFTLIELLVVIAIIAILAAILFPVFVRAKAAAQASHCQSNLNQIGKAMKMYLSDWEDTFPTNRMLIPPSTVGNVIPWVRLSNPALTDSNNEPIRFQYGFNWVEGLYPYIEKVAEGDAASAWKCPTAKSSNAAAQGLFASTSYSFNANLVEMPEGVVKNAGNLMMCRELDRRYDAVLRPLYPTLTSAAGLPNDPFLGPEDATASMRGLKYQLHGDGSTILMADGHVKQFSISYFAKSQGEWDTESKQYYNWVNTSPLTDAKRLSIAITP
jgi:prepilin-type N-terminal cleavage/methylation domain-containing protein/prepilin-type processing-associated H-X9-DG protein